MANKEKKVPFTETIHHSQDVLGLELKDAMDRAQEHYSIFKSRNEKLLERQNDQANAANLQLISHFALLATLTLTVVGFLLTQNSQDLTGRQEAFVLAILSSQIISLALGAYDYYQTIAFHKKWAKLYQNIDKEVDANFESGDLQWHSDLQKIESRHLENTPEHTNLKVTFAMIGFCMLGLVMLLALFVSYFYDIQVVQ